MKKSYVKPEVTLVRFELSEAIASCDVRYYDNHSEGNCNLNILFSEYPNVNFTTYEESCTNPLPLEEYCYFSSTDRLKLMNS